MSAARISTAAFAIVLASAGLLVAQEPPRADRSSLILAERGIVGDFKIGESIAAYKALLVECEPPSTFCSRDGSIRLTQNPTGKIQTIKVVDRNLFTNRFIRAEDSTLADVVRSYGKPEKTLMEGERLRLTYGTTEFLFEGVTATVAGDLLKIPVASITVAAAD